MPAAGALRIVGAEPAAAALLWLVLATSGVVLVEPAPHDGLMVLVIVGAVFMGLPVPRGIGALAVLVAVVAACDAFGSTQAGDIGQATAHSLVTVYLATMAVFIACVTAVRPATTVPLVASALSVAALVACVAGIVGYFALAPGADEMFTLYERARGTFKDPNVFGPFLVLPILFGMERLLSRGLLRSWYWPAVLAVLLAGLFLSFSRGAWANFLLSFLVFFVVLVARSREPAVHARAGLAVVLGGAVLALGLAYALSVPEVRELFAMRADFEQSYDLSPTGRFAGQLTALKVIATAPFGIGSTSFLEIHPEQPHNVYLNTFLNAGWIGGFAYIALVGLTLVRGLDAALRGPLPVGIVAVVFGAFFGAAVEGLIVDTDHWRHFYVELGMMWGIIAAAGLTAPGGAQKAGRSGRI